MTQPAYISSILNKYELGFRISGGDPTITYLNNGITAAQIADYCLSARNTIYKTGANSTSIPIVWDATAETVKHGVAAQAIEGAVVAGGPAKASTPLTNPATNTYNIENTSAEGAPETVAVKHGGSDIHIFAYTGTDPTKPVAGTPAATDWVVSSATACKVQTAASTALGGLYGSRVIDVDTTLGLVACTIRGC